jgi:c-di-GMP-binding flagellar brake protein YcgR
MEERRCSRRIYAQKHAYDYDCAIELGGRYYKARLVDLSQSGARLLLDDVLAIDLYGKMGVVKEDYYDQPFMEGLRCTVAWTKNDEVGLSFLKPLTLEYGALYLYYGNA